jgi:DUF971 family protein
VSTILAIWDQPGGQAPGPLEKDEDEVQMAANLGIDKLELTEDCVVVEWSDGHQSKYDSKYLRINCSCAECVEKWSNRKLLDPATVPADIHAEDYLMVGRYAVQFLWSDTHYTGIYPFKPLRALCQCDECKASRERTGI